DDEFGCDCCAAARAPRSQFDAGSPDGAYGSRRDRTLLFGRRATRPSHLVATDTPGIEAGRAAQHFVDRLIEVGGGLALEAERIYACDDERFQIRALESTFLELLHRVIHALVELQE